MNVEDQSLRSEAFLEDVIPHLPADLSVEQSAAIEHKTKIEESRSQIEIGDTEMQHRLENSEGYSHIDQLNSEIVVPEDIKSTVHQLDKSIMSQFDAVSLYTQYIEQR